VRYIKLTLFFMKIAVGLSGGVDSSVAALLLKQAGHEVIALFMQNWHDTTGTLHGDCGWKDDKTIAKLVAKKLDIPFHFVDLSVAYRQKVVDYMFEEYKLGRTPNPDILCNREIKFDVFLKTALELGVDCVATGHYCRKESFIDQNGWRYSESLQVPTLTKTRATFSVSLPKEQLSKAIFPIGHLLKPEVRRLAAEAGLPSAEKKDSQGICFVGKIDLPVFLQQKLEAKEGVVVEVLNDFYKDNHLTAYNIHGYGMADRSILKDISQPYKYGLDSGKVIGKHQGAHFYTIGQRKGLNIGGHVESIFVISTDVENNIIYVGEGQSHHGLYRKGLFIDESEIHWIRPDLKMSSGEMREYQVRIRYRQPLQEARLYKEDEGLYIIFDEPQRGITPGQFAAWYSEEEMLGSGVIC